MKVSIKQGYKAARAAAYPSIPDQLDKIYHEGVDAWREEIDAVKAQYPKDEPSEEATD